MDTGRVLGSGSFGIVNEGTWRDKMVAIKTMELQQNTSSTEESLAKEKVKFEDEATVAYSLNHKNIIKVLETCILSYLFISHLSAQNKLKAVESFKAL